MDRLLPLPTALCRYCPRVIQSSSASMSPRKLASSKQGWLQTAGATTTWMGAGQIRCHHARRLAQVAQCRPSWLPVCTAAAERCRRPSRRSVNRRGIVYKRSFFCQRTTTNQEEKQRRVPSFVPGYIRTGWWCCCFLFLLASPLPWNALSAYEEWSSRDDIASF